jgi:chromate transporter
MGRQASGTLYNEGQRQRISWNWMGINSPLQVLRAFLKLGLTCFGGPIAHIGYFRDEFVVRRRWVDEETFADLVALCQFLPGPASSQVGLSIGLLRAGYAGALAAWVGFTTPSAILMVLFAYGARALQGPVGDSLLHGLKLVAVAIVAQAVWGMARALCPDRERASIALLAALIILLSPSSLAQVTAIALGALLGWWLCRAAAAKAAAPQVAALSGAAAPRVAAPSGQSDSLQLPVSPRAGVVSLAAFVVLLVGLPVLRSVLWADAPSEAVAHFAAFYHSGALVFGGGHVVLPLLRETFVTSGWVSEDAFLAGYGAAQAIPGPLFTFGAYLGAVNGGTRRGVGGAVLGLIGIFLPGVLILLGTLPFWDRLRQHGTAQAAMRGVNAAVVGVLGAALYAPLWTSSVRSPADFAIALAGFVLLTAWRAPPLVVVVLCALSGYLEFSWKQV